MMKHLLFTSAIALFSMVTFAQNSNYGAQRNGGTMTGQQGGYPKSTSTTPKSTTQPVAQQPTTNYNPNNGNYKNTPQTNNGYPNGSGNYQGNKNEPANSYNQGREYDNRQMPERQPDYGYEQHGNNRRYVPVYRQPQYRRDYRYEQHRGHDHFDARGNYWY